MQDRGVVARGRPRDSAGCVAIDHHREFTLALGLVDGRIGGGVDHEARGMARDGASDGVRIADVAVGAGATDRRAAAHARKGHQFLANLTAGAENQDRATHPSRNHAAPSRSPR